MNIAQMKIGPDNQNLAGPAVILPASSRLSLVGCTPAVLAASLPCSMSSMSVDFSLSSPCLFQKPKPKLPDTQTMQSNCIERVTDSDTVYRPTDSAEEPNIKAQGGTPHSTASLRAGISMPRWGGKRVVP